MDDEQGYPPISGNLYIYICIFIYVYDMFFLRIINEVGDEYPSNPSISHKPHIVLLVSLQPVLFVLQGLCLIWKFRSSLMFQRANAFWNGFTSVETTKNIDHVVCFLA